MRRLLTIASGLALLVAAALAAGAHAQPVVTAFMDWSGSGNSLSADGLQKMQEAGATIVRLSVSWPAVAPSRVPAGGFRASDPSEPAYRWRAVDSAVSSVVAAGLQPMLDITGAPAWAQKRSAGSGRGPVEPDPKALGSFATAIATRYGGGFAGQPRVRYWELYNEPNLYLYLNPQFQNGLPFSPAWYRSMVNAFAESVHAVHADNVVAVGGLSPFAYKAGRSALGMAPMVFMRNFLCMSRGARPRPTCSDKVEFDAWTHHPYTSGGPTHKAYSRDDVSLGDLPEMKSLLDAAVRAGHVISRRKPQFWVTEFSWDSNPPDPKGVPLRLEARWVAEATYRMWQSGVSLFTWFALEDEPMSQGPYQSGLYFADGRPKLARQAFRFPVVAFVENGRIQVWGRTPFGKRGRVVVEQANAAGQWRRLAVLTSDGYGIFVRRLPARSLQGSIRARLLPGGELSVPFSLRVPPDMTVDPFGSRT